MARRWIVIGLAAFAALAVANILFLVFWLPHFMKSTNRADTTAAVVAKPAGTVETSAPSSTSTEPVKPATDMVRASTNATDGASASTLVNNAAAAGKTHALPSPPPLAAGFVFEHRTLSPSGNLQIEYSRDRKAKLRRITLEDAHHPGSAEVLGEYKHSAWVLVSPNDEWIALDERSGAEGGGVKLYHRSDARGVHYESADSVDPNTLPLQDSVWRAYLEATQDNPNKERHGVTIDATSWDGDSHKLDLSVAYVRSAGQTDIPEPWSCTYDVVSRRVEPSAPAEGPDSAAAENTTVSPAPNDVPEQNATPQNENPQGENAENASTDANEMDTQFPGEKFPATRQDALTVPDVNESSLSEISYAINEMYARHGLEYHDKKVREEFSQFPWYHPRAGVSRDQIESEFSDIEKQNLKVLSRCRDAKVAATHRHRQSNRGQPAEEESLGNRFLRDVLQGVSDGLQNQ